MKTLVQCDFDGTITDKDASFFILDAFVEGDWRKLLAEYKERKISVGHFNTSAFNMVKASEQALLKVIEDKIKIRPGLHQLIDYCQRQSFKFVIVSNGLDFYIRSILGNIGLENLEVHAAETLFHPEGLEVRYIGPDGIQLDSDFKEAYTRLFLSQGYRIIYVGNGASDIYPARLAHHVFARGELIARCKETKLKYESFDDLNSVVSGLGRLQKSTQSFSSDP